MRLSELVQFAGRYFNIPAYRLGQPSDRSISREQRIVTCACVYLTEYSQTEVASVMGLQDRKSVHRRITLMTARDYITLVDLIQAWRNHDTSRV